MAMSGGVHIPGASEQSVAKLMLRPMTEPPPLTIMTYCGPGVSPVSFAVTMPVAPENAADLTWLPLSVPTVHVIGIPAGPTTSSSAGAEPERPALLLQRRR